MINKLLIGSYIANGKIYNPQTSAIGKVLEIGNEEREFEQIYCECNESFDWFFKDNYCGIPLTIEILEKCEGWVIFHGGDWKARFDTGEVTLEYYPSGILHYRGYKGQWNDYKCEYLHELQLITTTLGIEMIVNIWEQN